MYLHPGDIMERERRHSELIRFIYASGEPFLPLERPVEVSDYQTAAAVSESVTIRPMILRTREPIGLVMVIMRADASPENEALRNNIGRFRYANGEEIYEATDGLPPLAIPPLGPPLFTAFHRLVVDREVSLSAYVKFKAAHPDRWVVMSGAAYMRLVHDQPLAALSLRPTVE